MNKVAAGAAAGSCGGRVGSGPSRGDEGRETSRFDRSGGRFGEGDDVFEGFFPDAVDEDE